MARCLVACVCSTLSLTVAAAPSRAEPSCPPDMEPWCLAKGVRIHDKLRLRADSKPGGASYWTEAAQSVSKGSLLAVAKARATLGLAGAPAWLQALKVHTGALQRDMLILATRLLIERAKGSESEFEPYIRTFPDPGKTMSATTWSTDLMAHLPARLRLRAERAQGTLHRLYKESIEPLAENHSQALPRNVVDFALLLWAYGIVSSRAFNGTSFAGAPSKRQGMFLFPGGDLLNHHANATVDYKYIAKEDAFAITSLSPLRAGEQAYNSYGPVLSKEDLVLGWGFFHEAAPHAVQLPLPRPKGDDSKARIEALLACGLIQAMPHKVEIASVVGLLNFDGSEANAKTTARDLVRYWAVADAAAEDLNSVVGCCKKPKGELCSGAAMLKLREQGRKRGLSMVKPLLVELFSKRDSKRLKEIMGATSDIKSSDDTGVLKEKLALQLRKSQKRALDRVMTALKGPDKSDAESKDVCPADGPCTV